MTRRGFFGSSSIAARMREMCTSIERSNASSRSFLTQIHERLARHHAAGMLGQREQQRELVAGERARLAVEPHLARAGVDLEPAEAQHLGAALAAARGAGSARSRASSSRGSNGFGR